MNSEEIMALINLLVGSAGAIGEAYSKLRKVATQNGVTEEQLAEADVRFSKHYDDPLPIQPPVIVEPPIQYDVTEARFNTLDEAVQQARNTGPSYFVIVYEDGKYGIWPPIGPVPGRKVWPI